MTQCILRVPSICVEGWKKWNSHYTEKCYFLGELVDKCHPANHLKNLDFHVTLHVYIATNKWRHLQVFSSQEILSPELIDSPIYLILFHWEAYSQLPGLYWKKISTLWKSNSFFDHTNISFFAREADRRLRSSEVGEQRNG